MGDPIVAILCSDIHLQHRPPAARAGEDWYAAMQRPLDELRELQQQHGCPIVCAGDVFDRWNSPPELINWAIRHLPPMHAVPGQHDLPHHRMDDIRRSAFWTLVEAEVLLPAWAGGPVHAGPQLFLHGFPWGAELRDCQTEDLVGLHVAVVHKFVWRKGFEHTGCSPEGHVDNVLKRLRGYSAVVCGDNHVHFAGKRGNAFWNCGSLMRRSVSQREHQPVVGLMHGDGRIGPYYLDTSRDQLVEIEDVEMQLPRDFLDELKTLDTESLDFEAAIRRHAERAGEPVRRVLLEAIDDRAEVP